MSPRLRHSERNWRPEEELILLAARTRSDSDTRARLATAAHRVTDWNLVVRHGFMHGLLPMVRHRLHEAGVDERVPAPAEKSLQDAYILSAARTLQLTAELGRVLDLLGDASIQALPTKGPVLGASLYEDPCLRPFVDLDIVVREEQVDGAIEALEEGGYRNPATQSESRRRIGRQNEYAAHLVHDGKRIPLDLHWDFARNYFSTHLPSDLAWRETRVIQLAGRPTTVPSPGTLLLTHSIHGAKHGPFPWPKLKWVVDVDGFLRSDDSVNWEALIDLSEEAGCRRMLLLGFALAACLLDSPLPGVVLHSLDRDPLVWKLTEPIESRLFAVGDRSLPLGQRIQLDLRLRERAGDRARYVMSRVTQPTGRDLDAASLPSVLSFLYLPIRLARLAGAYIAHPSRLRRLLIGGNTEESSG